MILFFTSLCRNIKLICLFFVVKTIPLFCLAQSVTLPMLKYDKRYGGSSDDRILSAKILDNFDIIMGGYSSSPASGDKSALNKGDKDYWVVLTDSSGAVVWDKTFGGPDLDELSVFDTTADAGFIFGGSSLSGVGGDKTSPSQGLMDFWVIKTDDDGNILWQQSYGGNKNDILKSLQETNDGGFILGGYSESDSSGNKIDSTRGVYDYWIVKIDSSGNIEWSKTFGGLGNEILSSIIQTSNDGYIIAGTSNSVIGGEKTQNPKGNYDYWIINLDQFGNVKWDKTIGGMQADSAVFIYETKGLGYVIFGNSYSSVGGDKGDLSRGNIDFWVVKLDSLGNKLWDRTYGGNLADQLTSVYVANERDFFLAGSSNSGISAEKTQDTKGGFDFWIVKIDSSGNKYWDVNYGGADDEFLYSIEEVCDKGFIAAGSSLSSISGDKTQDNRGEHDYWMLRTKIPTIGDFAFNVACNGETTYFLDLTATYPDSWSWDFGDPAIGSINNADSARPVHTYSGEGTYTVTLIVSEGCQEADTVSKQVTVLNNPILGKIDIGEDKEICEGESITLRAGKDIPDGSTYMWSTGETTETITVNKIGAYSVVVVNSNCGISDNILIDNCPHIYTPLAFTPNNDGLNDIFYIKGISVYDFELNIYNRWGELFYQSHDINEGWDGTHNGERVPEDVYVWQVFYRGLINAPHKMLGSITLIR